MDTPNVDGRAQVLQCTDQFIAALRATPAIQRFVEAERRFEADEEVQRLMETLQRFQRAQRTGEGSVGDMLAVRDAQVRIQNHPLVQEFLAARDGVGGFFQKTNQAISEVLGLDFGQTAGPASSGCC